MAEIHLTMPNNWVAKRHQRPAMIALDAGVKRHVWVWHRRAGKDSCAINWAAAEMAERPTSVLHLLPELTQAKRVIWREVDKETGLTHVKQAFPEPLLAQVNESEGFLRLTNGSIYQVGGFDRIDSYVGIGPQVVIMSEYAISPHAERAWNLLTPILRANDGVAIFAFTPRGHNWGKKLFDAASNAPGWFVSRLSIDDTGLVPVDAIKADIDAGLVDEETARQEWWVSWEAPNTGSYYGRAIEKLEAAGQVTDIAWEPSMPVYTAWDIGVSDATAIWFFQPYKTGWVNVIDYHEGEGEGLPHYLSLLNDRKAMGWTFDPRGQLVPHDFAARDFTSGEAPTQAAQRLGWLMTVVAIHDREHGIDAVRRLLPKCRFDRTRCAKGLERLKLYRKQWSKQLQLFTGPLHDANSHCFTGDTFILTRYGKRRIMNLPEQGEVLTPCGWKAYRRPRITRTDAPLVEVAFDDGSTARCTPDHMFLTASGWKSASDLRKGSLIRSSLTLSRSISLAVSTGYGRARFTGRALAKLFIETCGRLLSDLSPMGATFTTAMTTPTTTRCPTSSAFPQPSTCPIRGTRAGRTRRSISAPTPESVPPSGTSRKPAGFGINAMPLTTSSAPTKRERNGIAGFAARSSWLSSIFAGGITTAPATARWLTIASVRSLPERAEVWCLTVPDAGCFSLANGAVVHNCADAFRYLAMGLRQAGFATASSARVAEIQARDERPFAQAGVVVARTDWSAFDPGADERREERQRPYDPFAGIE